MLRFGIGVGVGATLLTFRAADGASVAVAAGSESPDELSPSAASAIASMICSTSSSATSFMSSQVFLFRAHRLVDELAVPLPYWFGGDTSSPLMTGGLYVFGPSPSFPMRGMSEPDVPEPAFGYPPGIFFGVGMSSAAPRKPPVPPPLTGITALLIMTVSVVSGCRGGGVDVRTVVGHHLKRNR